MVLASRCWTVVPNCVGGYPAATIGHHIATPQSMSANPRYSIRSVLTLAACMALSACGSFGGMNRSAVNPVNWLTPYKIDVIQGNFIAREQVEQLKAGMSRAEVKAVLGTPLLASVFHGDRWDYVFTFRRQGAEPQSLKYTVFFTGDQLARFEGDAMPSEAEFISRLDSRRKLGQVPVLQATEAQLKAAEKPLTTKPAVNAASVPGLSTGPQTTVYPPLESPKQ